MIRYHFDLYPRDDPKDGARLQRFTKLQMAEYKGEANGTGAGQFSIRASDEEVDAIAREGQQYIRVVREDTSVADGTTLSGNDEAVVGGFWLDQGDVHVLDEGETQLLTYGGAGTLSYLDRAVMWSYAYVTDERPPDGVWDFAQMFGDFTLGQVLRKVLAEAQLFNNPSESADDRTSNALPDLSLTFSTTQDSSGNAWTIAAGDFTAQVGESVLQVVKRLMEAGLYIEMDPDTFEVNAWEADNHGRDRTGLAFGADVVTFRANGTQAGSNILSQLTRGVSARRRLSVLLTGSNGLYADTRQVTGVEREGFYEYDSDSRAILEGIGASQLDAFNDATDSARLRFRLGNDPANGYYLPFEAAGVLLDDAVTVDTPALNTFNFSDATFPVSALTIKVKSGGDWEAWADLGSTFHSMGERAFQAQPVKKHKHPPNPRLCAPAKECSALTAADLTAGTATNGDVESGATNWSGGSASGAIFHGGTGGYAVTGATSADVTYDFGSQSFTEGTRYVIDIWRRVTADHDATTITFGDSGGDEEATTYQGLVGDDDPDLWEESETGADGETWNRGRVCWTPSATRTNVRVRIQAATHASSDFGLDDLSLSTASNNEQAGTSNRAARCDHTHHARDIPFSPREGIAATNVQAAIEELATGIAATLPWVNVLDHGADPTGVADSWQAFDDALETRTDRSAAVIVPPGLYRMSAPLVLGNSTVIFGVGANMEEQDDLTYRPHSVLYFDNDTDGIVAPDDAAVTYRCHHPVLENLTIRGGGAVEGNTGIWLRDNASSAVSIQRVGLAEIRNCFVEYWDTAYDFDGTADSCKVIGGHIHDCGQGFVGGLSEDVFDRVCVWNLSSGPAVSISGDRGQVIGCEIEPQLGSGIVVSGDFNRIVANDVKDIPGTAIDVSGDNNTIVANTASRDVITYYADTGTGNEWGHNTPADEFPAATGGAPTGAAGGDLSGTYPNPSVVDDSHSHTSATAPSGGIGPILVTSVPAGSPLVFTDLLQNSDGTDLLYASEP